MIIPEYKIELLNKSKKVINTVEHLDKVNEIKTITNNEKLNKNKSDKVVSLKKTKKSKSLKKKIKTPRTLWVRRKKRA